MAAQYRAASPGATNACPGGTYVSLGQSCTQANNTQLCPNGTRPLPGQSCIYITCPNGFQVPANVGCPAPTPTQLCPDGTRVPTSQACLGQNPTTTTSSPPPAAATPPGITVTYAAGWNIVAGPTGTTISGAAAPLYTLQPGDTNYETLAPSAGLKPGAGYLAYLPASTSATLPVVSGGSATVQLPPGQFVLIGNPGHTAATVTGADVVLVFNSASNSYAPAATLPAGQGAWAMSNAGGQVTITNSPS